jgi:SEC-C motif
VDLWRPPAVGHWSGHQLLRLRRKKGEISVEIDARRDPVQVRALLWRHGARISLIRHGIRLRLGQRAGVGVRNLAFVAAGLSLDPADGRAQIAPDPRFGHFVLVSRPTDETRLSEAGRTWRTMVADVERTIGRNDPCWCGSGMKFKRCHGQ